MKLAEHGRFAYSGIESRPNFHWPGNRRLAVYLGLNLEHFAFGDGLGGELAPGGPSPDVLNYAWREYGNRVGAWRLAQLFDEVGLPASLLVNSALYDHAPSLLARFRERGDEFVGHGRTNAERQSVLDEDGERDLIGEATETLTVREGRPPAGWLGPWIAESHATPELLVQAGYRYVLDWCHDDQPVWMTTGAGPLLAVPYPQELNDIPAVMVRRMAAGDFADMLVDQFDEMRRQSVDQPLVMGIALHAYIVGQPFRLRHLRRALRHIARTSVGVWPTTAGAIASHYAAAVPPPS